MEISDWRDNAGQQEFTLTLPDPKIMGLQCFEPSDTEKFIDKILLACNLCLIKAAFSRQIGDTSDTTLQFQDNSTLSSQTNVTETPGEGFRVEAGETIRIGDSRHVTVGFRDVLDEVRVLEILKKIDSLDVLLGPTKFQILDIRKSLSSYSTAMSIFDLQGIFKNLFNSLELSTNCDGQDRKSNSLDKEAGKIAAISPSKVKDWRDFNNFSKHISRNQQEEKLYTNALLSLAEKLEPLRLACQKIILDRLCNI